MANDWEHNDHWKVIAGGGVTISTTPEQLWAQICAYFKWVEDNPIKTKRTLTSGKEAGKEVTISYQRPYTVKAMCLHCGISEKYIKDIIETSAKESGYYQVLEKTMMLIYNQNLEGGLVDIFNPIMVSKVLNMDKPSNQDDKPVRVEIVNSEVNKLSNSENDILKNLDYGKVESLKNKLENPTEQSAHTHLGTHPPLG